MHFIFTLLSLLFTIFFFDIFFSLQWILYTLVHKFLSMDFLLFFTILFPSLPIDNLIFLSIQSPFFLNSPPSQYSNSSNLDSKKFLFRTCTTITSSTHHRITIIFLPFAKKKKSTNPYPTLVPTIFTSCIYTCYLFLRAKRVKLNTRAQPRVRACVWIRACTRVRRHAYIYIYIYVCVYVYIYMCVKCGSNGRCCVNSPRPSEVAV